jgi:hypothetical protein
MRIIKRVQDRRRERRERILDALEKRQDMNHEERLEAIRLVKTLSRELNKNKTTPLEMEGYGSLDSEPFGWACGTVRGMITIWVVLSFCILSMYNFMLGMGLIPINWYLGIVALIIGSYFYSRFKMGI